LHAGACAHTVAFVVAAAIKSCFATATGDFGFILIIVFDFFSLEKTIFSLFNYSFIRTYILF